jgi:aarF domain-containing kinase
MRGARYDDVDEAQVSSKSATRLPARIRSGSDHEDELTLRRDRAAKRRLWLSLLGSLSNGLDDCGARLYVCISALRPPHDASRIVHRMKRGIPTEGWRRSKSVIAMAAGVAGKELKHRARAALTSSAEKLGLSEMQTRIEQAKLMVESLGRLKGAFMKAGQLLSIDASDWLPPEAMEILAKLQGQAEPVDFEIIRGVLVSELGEERLAQLEGLDPIPAASASIGQVHRASVAGAPVAIKVQYPGIAESIDTDVGLLEKVGASFLTLSRREVDLKGLFEEMRTVLHLEADYERERKHLDRFAVLLENEPRFAVPKSFPALSTTRVLTMSWAEGVALTDWIRSEPPRQEREAFARAVLDLYCLEFFVWGLVQTDPNFGNFLIHPETQRIVLLDFGATLEYDEDFRRRYVELLRGVATGARSRIIEAGIDLGIIDPRESSETRENFADMLINASEPFEAKRQPFVFRDTTYAASSRVVVEKFVRSLVYTPPPRALIFLHRKLGGLFQLLRRLDVVLDLSPYWEKMIGG